ncbi:TonB-dependent receptor [Pseudomonadota bacterium]|nr:TonB-dependent receptor [Pseudomonadota bacterium]
MNKIIIGFMVFYSFSISQARSEEELVITATRVNSKLSEIPFSVNTIGKDQIEKGQYLNLDESLNQVPGLYFSNRYNYSRDLRMSIRGFGARSNFGIRGIQVFIDGIPSTTPDGQTVLDDLDLSIVKQIEILRGTSSALYGSSSGGVVNIITESGLDISGGSFNSMIGDNSFLRNSFKLGEKIDNFDFSLSGAHLNYGGYREHSNVEQTNLGIKAGYDFNENYRAEFILRAVDSPYAEDAGGLNSAERKANKKAARQRNIDLNAGEAVTDKKMGVSLTRTSEFHRLELRNYFNWRDFDARLPITPFIGAGIVKLDRTIVGGGIEYENSHNVFGYENQFFIGFDYDSMKDDRRRFDNLDGSTGDLQFEQNEKAKTLGLFLQEKFFINDKTSVLAGLRYDHVDFEIQDKFLSNGDQTEELEFNEMTYSIGVSYNPKSFLNYYFNYSTAFETPTFTEFANPSSNGTLGGFANVSAQKSNGYELGVRVNAGKLFKTSLVYYHLDVEDEVTTVSNVDGRAFFNNADTRRSGVELDFQVRLVENLDLSASFTHSNLNFTKFVNTPEAVGNRLPGVPKQHGYLGLNYENFKGVFANWNINYVGKIYANNVNTVSDTSYLVSNLVFGHDYKFEKYRLLGKIGINNLFDKDYNQEIRIQDATSRFFETAPKRNFFGSIEFQISF